VSSSFIVTAINPIIIA